MTMNLSGLFFTPLANGGQQIPPALGGGKGLFGATPGLNFMDILFGLQSTPELTAPDPGQEPTKKDGEEPVQDIAGLILSPLPVIQTEAPPATDETGITTLVPPDSIFTPDPLPLESISAPDLEIPWQKADQPVVPAAQDSNVPAHKDFLSFLNGLLAGIPQENRPVAIGMPAKTPGDLMFDPGKEENGDAPPPSLIATGFDPAKLTQFVEELAERTQQGESFIVGLVRLLPPQAAKREAIFFPRAIIVPAQPSAETAIPVTDTTAAAPAQDAIATQLNALTAGEGSPGESSAEKVGFEKVLDILNQAQQKQPPGQQSTQQPGPANANTAAKPAATHPGPILPAGGHTIFSHTLPENIFPEGLKWTQAHDVPGGMPVLTFNGPAMGTSLVTQASQAALPHPATQMVAATITKALADGQTRNITLRLEPPELGRVEIRLEFAKEKTLKTHILVEKQETWLMLQRDSHVLERALQDAGLDTDSGLSFELAHDDSSFDEDRKGGGYGGGGRNSDSGPDDETTILHTHMDIYVDPETGLTRYDILA